MTELRVALLVLALVLLLGVFLWSRYGGRTAFLQKRPAPQTTTSPAAVGLAVARPGESVAGQARRDEPGMVITVRLVCRDAAGFPAEIMVAALREAGLSHGRYGIFHRHVTDERSPTVFGCASLVEPGSFDLTRLHIDRYPGVSLFLALPAPVDGVAAFDALIATSRGLARRLEGDLLDEHGSTLSVQRERYLREEVIQFCHRRAAAS